MSENQIKIPKRILSSLLTSLSAGVVPRVGAPYIAIGRTEEISALCRDLETVSEGGAFTRFIIGKYGSGKSFLVQLIRGYATEHGFVCADADLSPERKLASTGGVGLATYKELMKNLSVKTSSDGGALTQVIARWFSDLRSEVASGGLLPGEKEFEAEVSRRIYDVMRGLQSGVGSFDFSRVLEKYYRAYVDSDEETVNACLRWLRGEYRTKTEARADLGVTAVIDDANWYEYIKLLALFVRKIGYSGLIVFIDECVNLYKIPNRISRENNYEKILSIYNDTMQGKADGLGVIFAGTPQFLEDPRRGLFSYEALRSRLSDASFASSSLTLRSPVCGPVIRLVALSDDGLLALIARITTLYEQCYGSTGITPEEMKTFLYTMLQRAGAQSLMTPRELIRAYLAALGMLSSSGGEKRLDDIIGKTEVKAPERDPDALDPDNIDI